MNIKSSNPKVSLVPYQFQSRYLKCSAERFVYNVNLSSIVAQSSGGQMRLWRESMTL